MNALLLLFFAAVACRAEVIDRIAVVVGNGVITESEILREIRLTAFLEGEPLDFSPEVMRKTAGRMVEQRLIGNEIGSSLYPPAQAEAVEQLLKQAQERFPNAQAYRQELERTGITEDELKAHLERSLTTLRFIDFRFRPAVQISEADAAKYFTERVLPELKKANPAGQFFLNDYRSQVQEGLIGERVDQASDEWLKEARSRTRIEYRPEAFAAADGMKAEPRRQEASK
jgi:parvulin-like peptidyl-prolyl isomerase